MPQRTIRAAFAQVKVGTDPVNYATYRRGEKVDLSDEEASRLDSLGALEGSDQPDSLGREQEAFASGPAYQPIPDQPDNLEGLSVDQLKELADQRGVEVEATGKSGPVRDDYLKALGG